MAILVLMILLMIVGLVSYHQAKPARLLTVPNLSMHLDFAKIINHQGHKLYIEQVSFADYQAAIHGYFVLTSALEGRDVLRDSRYDFFDFYSVVLCFDDDTLRLLRLVDKVRVVKSDKPINIDEFERLIAGVMYD